MKKSYYFFCYLLVAILFIVVTPTAFGKYKLETGNVENVRVSEFKINTYSPDASENDVNKIQFNNANEKKEITFTIENEGEVAVFVEALLYDKDHVEFPYVEFKTENNVYLAPHETKKIQMEVSGVESYGFFEITKELQVQIITHQLE